MGKTTYREAWEKDFRWLKRTVDSSRAFCKLRQKTFKIDASGTSQVKLRASGAKHKERENILAGNSSQSHFTASDGKTATLSKGSVILTNEEQVLKAEIIQALKIVDGNFSPASANGDGDRFRTMFPDSAIAKSYKQGETKVKYCLQYGIAPHLKDLIVKDLANSPFTFKFGETTTSQVKKQYHAHVQFWSEKENRVIIAYCGSLFVGHCTAEDLVSHFSEFGIRMKWDPKYLLHIGMDGPNVNLSFEKSCWQILNENIVQSFQSWDHALYIM